MSEEAAPDPSLPCPPPRRRNLGARRSRIGDPPVDKDRLLAWRRAFSRRPPVAEAGSEIKARARPFLRSCKNLRQNRGGGGAGGLSEGGVVGT